MTERRSGHSKLVYDKAKRAIVTVRTPWYVEREDDDDGSINYHVWSKSPVMWLFTVYGRDHTNAKDIAALVVAAVNSQPSNG